MAARKKPAAPVVVYGNVNAVAFADGIRYTINKDEPVSSSDPAVKALPAMFSATPSTIETATAAPGEKRSTAREAKVAADAQPDAADAADGDTGTADGDEG